ncbi:SGNH/GDSL hydrolase family protein [Paucibacter sp. R3-3]|uniref:SGNH/GDSL hydrolase family protein n=1 Tax=Roseateles agri TaxID=3098619 RepID=A0ABU5DE91_9BURK|nr:SGNH/GDSL hydrolase family protein [Paucibacter sp. R3-3]MDY0743579.1 SGNH/GDSL hydrolase family protein [Paucibacter sp. R3-3]
MKSFSGASRLLAAFALAVLMSACGGGSSQIDPFHPTRIISFGDETSAITATGQKYTVNGLDATTKLQACQVNPNWVQILATAFELVFPQCNPDHIALPQGLMYATSGAKVDDLATQIDRHLAVSNFSSKDLVTILIGTNDVLELYKQYPGQSEDSLITQAKQLGIAVADQVNRVANQNGRVIVSTLPDLGYTPYALKEQSTKFDIDRAKLLSDLSNAFNVAMRLELINDGRMIGLVLLDESVQTAAKFPTAFSLTNVTDPACLTTVSPVNCNENTLVVNATGTTWLWATDTLLSAIGQSRLGSLAQTRAQNNPF